jgi:hypothetical protein
LNVLSYQDRQAHWHWWREYIDRQCIYRVDDDHPPIPSSDGTPAIWLMNGLNFMSGGAVGPVNPGPSWQIWIVQCFDPQGRCSR